MSESTQLPTALRLFDLSGRTALITGSSGGIGLALARGLLSAGAQVILNGRQAQKLDQATAQLRAELPDKSGQTEKRVTCCAFDVTRSDEVDTANNAGMTYRAPLDQFPTEQWHQIMRTNLDSAFFVSRAVVRHMIPRGRGKLINICSVQSELGRPGIAPYAASKGGMKMLTIDLAKHGLQVNGLGPGYFKTELTQALVADANFSQWLVNRTPSGRWGQVEDLIGAAVFLSSHASDFVNGHVLYVDGGVTATL